MADTIQYYKKDIFLYAKKEMSYGTSNESREAKFPSEYDALYEPVDFKTVKKAK